MTFRLTKLLYWFALVAVSLAELGGGCVWAFSAFVLVALLPGIPRLRPWI